MNLSFYHLLMRLEVRTVVARRFKSLPALVALEGLLTSVDFLVSLQIGDLNWLKTMCGLST